MALRKRSRASTSQDQSKPEQAVPLPGIYRKILEQLGLREGNNSRFALPQLRYSQGHCFIRLDDNIRADKDNPDLVEITMSEYERLIEKK